MRHEFHKNAKVRKAFDKDEIRCEREKETLPSKGIAIMLQIRKGKMACG